MIRRQLSAWCVLAGLTGGITLLPLPAKGQQPQAPARARVNTAPAQQPGAPAQPPANPQAPPRAQRPEANLVQTRISKELEDLLILWERKSSEITRLSGNIERYTYDQVYHVEKRGIGKFYYQSPDQGRIDFEPSPDVAPSKQKGKNGEPFTVQQEGHQRWICNGKMIYIINDDAKMADQVQIPAHQQGKNIVNGPLPFLFGMKAEQAKQRYDLSIGMMHWPQGVVRLKDGSTKQVPPQIHVVARPKFQVDAAEWSKAEVLLDPRDFVPTAIRLTNPQETQLTVYRFASLKKNEAFVFNNPFNDRPPSNYTIGQPSRATNDETPVAQPK